MLNYRSRKRKQGGSTLNIKLGYEVGSGEEINIAVSHLVVTGITQESGKTTALTALLKRGNLRAVIFKTKPGERGITEGTNIMPFFKEQFDWEYAVDLLEASRKEKLKFERSWIIKYSKKATNLVEFKANIDQALAKDVSGEKKLRELEKSVLISLQAYLDKILPELQFSPLSSELEIHDGINIMDLERFKEETQSIIIRSVLDEILKNFKNITVVIPEAWSFIPQKYSNPVKRSAERYIRQGATNNNFLFLDSQEITGTDKTILKQVSTWILGYQREINEIQRTMDQIPLPKSQKPKAEDIASLKLGHFFVATKEFTKKVYVQPSWMSPKLARKIAKGLADISTIEEPVKNIKQIGIEPISINKKSIKQETKQDTEKIRAELRQEIDEVRRDFLGRINELNLTIKNLYEKIYNLKPQIEINESAIINRILQKIPLNSNNVIEVDKEAIILEVLNRMPKTSGSVVYEISPLEKIKKDFLEEAKSHILKKVSELDEDQKRILKFIETQSQGVSLTKILDKCLYLSSTSGGNRVRVRDKLKKMANMEIIRLDKNNTSYPHLKSTITSYLREHEATNEEIEQVYNHILFEMV